MAHPPSPAVTNDHIDDTFCFECVHNGTRLAARLEALSNQILLNYTDKWIVRLTLNRQYENGFKIIVLKYEFTAWNGISIWYDQIRDVQGDFSFEQTLNC
jgi:hypothetical protein